MHPDYCHGCHKVLNDGPEAGCTHCEEGFCDSCVEDDSCKNCTTDPDHFELKDEVFVDWLFKQPRTITPTDQQRLREECTKVMLANNARYIQEAADEYEKLNKGEACKQPEVATVRKGVAIITDHGHDTTKEEEEEVEEDEPAAKKRKVGAIHPTP